MSRKAFALSPSWPFKYLALISLYEILKAYTAPKIFLFRSKSEPQVTLNLRCPGRNIYFQSKLLVKRSCLDEIFKFEISNIHVQYSNTKPISYSQF